MNINNQMTFKEPKRNGLNMDGGDYANMAQKFSKKLPTSIENQLNKSSKHAAASMMPIRINK